MFSNMGTMVRNQFRKFMKSLKGNNYLEGVKAFAHRSEFRAEAKKKQKYLNGKYD